MTIFNMKAINVAKHLSVKYGINFTKSEFKAEYHNGTGYMDKLAYLETDKALSMRDEYDRNIFIIPHPLLLGGQESWDAKINHRSRRTLNLVIFDRHERGSGSVVVSNGDDGFTKGCMDDFEYHPGVDQEDKILLACLKGNVNYTHPDTATA